MNVRSFRFRLGAYATLVAGIILTLFGIFAWVIIYRTLETMVDARIMQLGPRMTAHISKSIARERLMHGLDRLKHGLRFTPNGTIVTIVQHADNKILFQSDSWPQDLSIEHEKRTQLTSRSKPADRLGRPEPRDRVKDGEAERANHRRTSQRGFPFVRILSQPPVFFTHTLDETSWTVGVFENQEVTLTVAIPHGEQGDAKDHATKSSLVAVKRTSDRAILFQSDDWPKGLSLSKGVDHEGEAIQERKDFEHPNLLHKRKFRGRPRFRGRRSGPGSRPLKGHLYHGDLTKEPIFYTKKASDGSWRMGTFENEVLTVYLGLSLDEFLTDIRQLRLAFLIALPIAIGSILGGCWFVSNRATKPLRAITETAEKVTAQGLHQRIPVPGSQDELARLATVFNAMLSRLERSFDQAIRFSADASHELKTPLTIMQAEFESAIKHAEPGSMEQRTYTNQLEELQRLITITSSLLILSKADAGKLQLNKQCLDLSQLVEEICEDAQILAEGSSLDLKTQIAQHIQIKGDKTLLQKALQNLVSNAVKYNTPGGRIACCLDLSDGMARFEIANTGPGIPEADREEIFNRFHRADSARSREIDGLGLGLNLTLEIARAHGGTLTLKESSSEITCFCLKLPF